MALWRGRSRRKVTGGRRVYARSKRRSEVCREQQFTSLGGTSTKRVRTRGGNLKHRVLKAQTANVYDPKKKVTKPAEIVRVTENPANPHYVRRGILTKGAVVETKLGHARITSRPGQDGVINAVLME